MLTNIRSKTAILVAAVAITACSGAGGARPASSPGAAAAESDLAAIAQARADSVRRPYTEADISFMSGMILHHAQAIRMSRLAPTHGASPSVATLASRIINSQRDEIVTMQQWLRDRLQPVPEVAEDGTVTMPADPHAGHGPDHSMHTMLMPGMLTAEQMAELDAARGGEFDYRFLSSMIAHHAGAVQMVEELFSTDGAAQDETVFKFAADVNVDQTTEIERMREMRIRLILEGEPAMVEGVSRRDVHPNHP